MSEASDLVSLSASVAARRWDLVRENMAAIHAARGPKGASPVAAEEALLQCYLFLGFPAVLEGFFIWRDVIGNTESVAPREGVEDSLDGWMLRGQTVGKRVYQHNYENLRANVHQLHPALDRWMISEGYGKVLGRPGLSLGVRELCTVAILAATGWERQLHSHLRGALNVGVSRADIEDALDAGLRLATEPDWNVRAKELWTRICDDRNTATG